MSTYSITHAQRLDDYLVIQTLEGTDIGTGQVVAIAEMPPAFAFIEDSYVVQAVPTHLFIGVDDQGDFMYDTEVILPNQLLMYLAGDNFERQEIIPAGELTWDPVCTWVGDQSVIDWLGIAAATANDETFITACTAAANQWAYRRRREAGYFDSPSTVPGSDVSLGTTMYAAVLYRERGSVDSFASFEGMGVPTPYGSNGQINRLLGINRSQVA